MSSVSLIPLLIFLFACLIVAFLIRKRTPYKNFEREYFVGGRSLGPLVLVMTTIATFGSITAFVGMPGQAWDYGFGWVYLSCARKEARFDQSPHPCGLSDRHHQCAL